MTTANAGPPAEGPLPFEFCRRLTFMMDQPRHSSSVQSMLDHFPVDQLNVILLEGRAEAGACENIEVPLAPRRSPGGTMGCYFAQFGVIVADMNNQFVQA